MRGLIDSGCSVTLIGKSVVWGRRKERCEIKLETMSGSTIETRESVRLCSLRTDNCVELGPVQAFVLPDLPLAVDLVIGLDLISKFGLTISPNGKDADVIFHMKNVSLCADHADNVVSVIDDDDFRAEFKSGHWVVEWKYDKAINDDNIVRGNKRCFVRESDYDAVDDELNVWRDEGIIVRYDKQKHGDIKRFIPLLSVRQEKGSNVKVRPVFDYREMNKDIRSHPAGATPLCADRLRQWRQLGRNCSIVDLRKAYLQVHVEPSLWTHQAFCWKGEVFLLTRLGFGLATGPKIMTAIVEKVISSDKKVERAVTSYIDDLFVVEDKLSCEEVRGHFSEWGLQTKPPERLGETDTRILGVKVDQTFGWGRDGLPAKVDSTHVLTRRQVHGILGEWIGHFPVAGWLRVACGYIQRHTALEGINWDEPVSQGIMDKLNEMSRRISTEGDPVAGTWPVDTNSPITLWTDASNMAIGVVVEIDNDIVEDAAWLRPKHDSSHINRAELDAVVKGINLAIKWGNRDIRLMCDSATVCGWMRSILEKSHNIKTTALGEILIRRRLDTIREIIAQEKLNISIHLVRSEENLADALTRVPKHWEKSDTAELALGCAESDSVNFQRIKEIHNRCHFGVERTLQLAQERYGTSVSRRVVKKVVSRCHPCSRIDPAVSFKWDSGEIASGAQVWERLAIDVTYFDQRPYLSLTDVASDFTVWRKLRNETSKEISDHMRQVFSEFGPPNEILCDNATVFRSRDVKAFLEDWEVKQIFSCAYRSQGNAVAERMHRTVKRAARRTARTIEEAAFWVNNTRTVKGYCPYELVFCARSKKPGVSSSRKHISRPELAADTTANDDYSDTSRNPLSVGDHVYLRPQSGRCDAEWTGPHRVTTIRSSVSVEIDHDGVSRHVSHLRLVPLDPDQDDDIAVNKVSTGYYDDEDEEWLCGYENESSEPSDEVTVRRSNRIRYPPRWMNDYAVY